MSGLVGKMRAKALWTIAIVWLAWMAAPGLAAACSVCTAGRDEENQLAFLLSTIFMSVLPLLVIGTIVFVLWRRIRQAELADPAPAARPRDALGQATLSGLGESGSGRS
jgi:ABC-type transport system involved in multi-copper enzyme maturation permease subunit